MTIDSIFKRLLKERIAVKEQTQWSLLLYLKKENNGWYDYSINVNTSAKLLRWNLDTADWEFIALAWNEDEVITMLVKEMTRER